MGRPCRILVEKDWRPAASAIVVRHPQAKYFVVDNSVGSNAYTLNMLSGKGRTYMSSKTFVPAAVFVLCLVCVVGQWRRRSLLVIPYSTRSQLCKRMPT